MSDAEIERIFRSLDRIEARLAALEQAEASRAAIDAHTSMSKYRIAIWSGVMVGAASVCTTILLHFTNAV
jgi:hypothetical protein